LPIVLFLVLLSFSRKSSTSENATLSLHDALPISTRRSSWAVAWPTSDPTRASARGTTSSRRRTSRTALSSSWRRRSRSSPRSTRSEEHTSELQSRGHLVSRLLLEKKKRTPADGAG